MALIPLEDYVVLNKVEIKSNLKEEGKYNPNNIVEVSLKKIDGYSKYSFFIKNDEKEVLTINIPDKYENGKFAIISAHQKSKYYEGVKKLIEDMELTTSYFNNTLNTDNKCELNSDKHKEAYKDIAEFVSCRNIKTPDVKLDITKISNNLNSIYNDFVLN